MKCYYHHDVDAVGICKSCNKGLCEECIELVGRSISCKGDCADTVRLVDTVIKKNVSSSRQLITPLFLTIAGVVFILMSYGTDHFIRLAMPGVVLAVWGAVMFYMVTKRTNGNK